MADRSDLLWPNLLYDGLPDILNGGAIMLEGVTVLLNKKVWLFILLVSCFRKMQTLHLCMLARSMGERK